MADVIISQPYFSVGTLTDWHWTRGANVDSGIPYTNGSQQKLTLTGTFNATGDFSISGTITQVTLTQSGTEVFKATGLNLDAATLVKLVENASGGPSQAFAYLLGGNDTIHGSSGDDIDLLAGGRGNDTIDGGKGIDTLKYSGSVADYKIERIADGWTVTDLKGDGGTDTLRNVETVQFADKVFLPVDVNGASGQVVRLYQAALDRAPDVFGMNFWEAQMEKGLKLESIAQAFVLSAEFQKLYGTGHTNTELVGAFYQHILHRTGEQSGIDFWAGVLDRHAATTAQVLAAISDSPENVQLSVGLIGAGLTVDIPVMTI